MTPEDEVLRLQQADRFLMSVGNAAIRDQKRQRLNDLRNEYDKLSSDETNAFDWVEEWVSQDSPSFTPNFARRSQT